MKCGIFGIFHEKRKNDEMKFWKLQLCISGNEVGVRETNALNSFTRDST